MSFFTPAPTPPTTDDPTNFDARADAFLTWMADFPDEAEAYGAFLAAANMFGVVIPYIFTTSTSGDPGTGKLGFNAATQNTLTGMNADTTDSLGRSAAAMLLFMNESTSAVKGVARVMKAGDSSVWAYVRVTLVTSPTGYKSIAVTLIDSSSTNPFADGDAVILAFVPKGDKGDQGLNAPWVDVLAGLTISGSPSTITISSIPTGYGDLRLRLETTLSTSAILRMAFSDDGTNFTSNVGLTPSASTLSADIQINDLTGGKGSWNCRSAGSATFFGASTRDALALNDQTFGVFILPARITHVRLSPSTGTFSSGLLSQPRGR